MTKVLDSLNRALHQCLAADDRVLVMGEDILDPYGGAFKATKGLSSAYADRVLTTPVSEAAIVGVAAGMALRGLRPVVEIMFGDFTTLIVDQLVNHASKFSSMYGQRTAVPLVVRTPMGGRRGYGPTHSQSIEKLFLGVPGLRVLAANAVGDPGALLAAAVLDDDPGRGPVLFVENKILYNCDLHPAGGDDDLATSPLVGAGLSSAEAPAHLVTIRNGEPATVTIAAYGYGAELARQALLRLAYEFEVFAELVVVAQLAPWQPGPVSESLRRTGRLVVLEEGTRALGWGAEVVATAVESPGVTLVGARRVAADDAVLPAAPALEVAALPGVDDVVKAALELAGQ